MFSVHVNKKHEAVQTIDCITVKDCSLMQHHCSGNRFLDMTHLEKLRPESFPADQRFKDSICRMSPRYMAVKCGSDYNWTNHNPFSRKRRDLTTRSGVPFIFQHIPAVPPPRQAAAHGGWGLGTWGRDSLPPVAVQAGRQGAWLTGRREEKPPVGRLPQTLVSSGSICHNYVVVAGEKWRKGLINLI